MGNNASSVAPPLWGYSRHRIFVAGEIDDSVRLPPETQHYLKNVLRCRLGDPLILFSGDGYEYQATVATTAPQLSLSLHKRVAALPASPLHLTLAIALIRAERFDWAVQKATELGVKQIQPLVSQYTQGHFDQGEKKYAHWYKVAVSAAEQCGRAELPEIKLPIALKDFVTECQAPLIALVPETTSLVGQDISALGKKYAVCVGPEGGWSKQEEAYLREKAALCTHVGPRILRSETAATVALTLLQAQGGDLSSSSSL